MDFSCIGSQPWPKGSYELGLFILLSRSFLRISSLFFSGTQHDVRSSFCTVYDKARFFENNIFAPKIGQKKAFLSSLGNLVIILFCIWSITKVSIICCILAQNLAHEIWANMPLANQIAGFSNQLYL